MIVVVEPGRARLHNAHDYTAIEVAVPQSLHPDEVASALSASALGGVVGDSLHLDVAGLARMLRLHNAYAPRWFAAAVGCAGVSGWVREGDRLRRVISVGPSEQR